MNNSTKKPFSVTLLLVSLIIIAPAAAGANQALLDLLQANVNIKF